MISDFQLFGDSGPGFEFSKKLNLNTYRGGMISALDPDPGSAFGPFDDSGYEFIKNWNCNNSTWNLTAYRAHTQLPNSHPSIKLFR